MLLEANQIEVRRLGRVVLRDLSLRVQHGECISVIGPNGAGKSTLMSALLGLLPLEAGQVRLEDQLIKALPRRQIARRIAYVPQIHEGYLGFTVRDIVASGRFAWLEPLSPLREADHQAIASAVSATRIEPLLERTVDTLSGGERQKVWIAAALAQQTAALFLDEPTNALDPAHQAELIHLMRRLIGEGKTLMVICHDLNLPIALGGRVVALRDQGILFDGAVDAFMDSEHMSRLFGTIFSRHASPDGEWSLQLKLSEGPCPDA